MTRGSSSPDASLDRVRQYYESFDEWARLDSAPGRLEFDRTLHVLDRVLAPGSRVLDLGGGPGRYTIALARRGHRVALADISPALLDDARRRIADANITANVESITSVDGVRLDPFADAAFDAVLAFGPFYHLVRDEERRMLAAEIERVARKGASVVAVFLPRQSGVAGLIARAARDPSQVPLGTLTRALETGVFVSGASTGFQEGWYGEPAEIKELFEGAGLQTQGILSVKGLAASREEEVWKLQDTAPEVFDEVLALLESTQGQPEIVAAGDQALWIGQKPNT